MKGYYYGEYPLAWCICWDDKVTYQKLLQLGANPNFHDEAYGNTCVHLIVVRSKRVSVVVLCCFLASH